jgi:hypothetical protein
VSEKENEVTNEEGWIEWNGGKCPVKSSVPVYVKLRDGYTDSDKDIGPVPARYWPWRHKGSGNDIIAYRVVIA